MLFIVSNNVDKVDPATRKLIRSHAMAGKRDKRRPLKRHEKKRENTARRSQTRPVKPEDVAAYPPLLPGRVGSDLSFVEFADEVEASLLMNIVKCS
jgi:hypothetical protein